MTGFPAPDYPPSTRLYWWLLECAHYQADPRGEDDVEMPWLWCTVCQAARRGVNRLPGFAQFGD